MGTHLKTIGIQIYLRIWGCYDPVESGPSETKIGGLYGCSVRKSHFRAIFQPPETTLQCGQDRKVVFWGPFMMVTIFFEDVPKKMISGQKTAFWGPERATLGNRGHETVRRAAKRPPTGKPKVSRVTSGYGGLMIPLSRDRLSRKNGGFIGVA